MKYKICFSPECQSTWVEKYLTNYLNPEAKYYFLAFDQEQEMGVGSTPCVLSPNLNPENACQSSSDLST